VKLSLPRSPISGVPRTLLDASPACSNPRSSVRTATLRNGGGTSPSAILSANPSTTAVLPTPASPVRIGLFLAPPHQDVDELPDFEVAARDRIDGAVSRPLSEIDRVLIQGFGAGRDA